MVEDLQRTVQRYDERVEDLSTDLETALQAKKRLQNELEDYRSQHAHDVEDSETSLEQTRKKYLLPKKSTKSARMSFTYAKRMVDYGKRLKS